MLMILLSDVHTSASQINIPIISQQERQIMPFLSPFRSLCCQQTLTSRDLMNTPIASEAMGVSVDVSEKLSGGRFHGHSN
jgi:hypothetical protein